MAWVQPNWAPGSNGYDPALLAMDDGSATGYRWQISDNRQSLILNNGSSSQSVALDLTDDNPHHVALAMDNGIWTAYLDGRPAGTITQTFGTQTGLPLHIGGTALASTSMDHSMKSSSTAVRCPMKPFTTSPIQSIRPFHLFHCAIVTSTGLFGPGSIMMI